MGGKGLELALGPHGEPAILNGHNSKLLLEQCGHLLTLFSVI